MEKRIINLLSFAKYSSFFLVFFLFFSSYLPGRPQIAAAALVSLLVYFFMDFFRHLFLTEINHTARVFSIYAQVVAATVYGLLEPSGVVLILYIVIITESVIFFPRNIGDRVFCLSTAGFLVTSFIAERPLRAYMINIIALIFTYTIGYLAKLQAEEKKRSETTMQELVASRRELKDTYSKLLENYEERERMLLIEERNRLAREVHDTLAHTLTSLIVTLEVAKKFIERDPERAHHELFKCQEQARKGLEDVRRSVRALRPRVLEELGFAPSIRALAREYSERAVKVKIAMNEKLVPLVYELPFYRAIQECMTNSVRHGHATEIEVTIIQVANLLILEVVDNGCGAENLTEGTGLQGIKRRIEALGGHVTYKNRDPKGFLVRIEVELNESDQNSHS